MANIILHHDGAYNVYATIDKAPAYERPLTLKQLKEAVFMIFSDEEMEELPDMLERAHHTGCSSDIPGMTLDKCIQGNRAGWSGTELSTMDFIGRYLAFN